MKPTFEICFTNEHPTRPGLWLNRRDNFIGVLDVQQSDIERDAKEGNWLDGQWAAELKLVERDVVPLQKKKIQEYLDKAITDAHEQVTKTKHSQDETIEELEQHGDNLEAGERFRANEQRLAHLECIRACLQEVRRNLLGDFLVLPEDTDDTEQAAND